MNPLNKFSRNVGPDYPKGLSTISRTQVIDGFSIPGIIHNGDYHFTNLQVYSDGLVYCWDMVDFELLRQKLETGWVATAVPDGGRCSAFELGMWKVANGEWLHDPTSYLEYVRELVKALNPEMTNLYDCHGTTTRVINGVNVAVFSSHDPEPYYISKEHRIFPERTRGKGTLFFFRHSDNCIYLVTLSVFHNGHVEVTSLPQRSGFEMEDVREMITEGRLFTKVPAGERVHALGLGSFKIVDGSFVDIEEKYKELLDQYQSMNGGETSLDRCRRILEGYRVKPTVKGREELKEAYEAIPAHNRIYVGDMDLKDTEVRMIIYGEQEIERWSHYWAAKEFGEELPVIKIPKPEDEDAEGEDQDDKDIEQGT